MKKNVDRVKAAAFVEGILEDTIEVTIKDGVAMDQEIKFTQKAKTFVKKHKGKFLAGTVVIAGAAVGAIIKHRQLGDRVQTAREALMDELDGTEDIEPIEY